jgi:MFS family permease
MVFMTIGTGGLVFLPGYETIGMAAPVILVLVRMLQGLAWGGEAGPATTFIMEAAPEGKRAFYTSWQIVAQGLAGISAGLIGYTLTLILTPEQLSAWGWRVPFAFGLLILPIAIYLRRNLNETFTAENSAASKSTGSLLGEVMRNYRGLILVGIFILSGSTITQYFLNYMTTYALKELAFAPGTAMASTILIGVCVVIFSLVGGWMADRFGRKITIIAPRLLLLLLLLPGLEMINAWRSEGVFFAIITLFAALQCISGSGVLVVLCENFPRYIRSTGFSIAFAFGITLFGGTAQIVFSWLIKWTGDPVSPGYYLIAANILCLMATLMLKERVPHRPPPGESAAGQDPVCEGEITMKTVLRWDEWAACDATALAELVARGDVSARELALQAQAATQRVNPQISAVVELFDDAIDQPETDGTCLAGRFKGFPS